jgi:predicted ABC-type ATPase
LKEKIIYIIAGCNGAGKTTASFTILPEILDCKEFVNADEIAKGLSPFQPEKVAFEAGRIMLERIEYLLSTNENFAFETTLATKTHKSKLEKAIRSGFTIKLLFFWLPTIDMAIERVGTRVKEGGHHIPTDVIIRRYSRGIDNLFKIYIPLCSEWAVFDNSEGEPHIIAQGIKSEINVIKSKKWNLFKSIIP